MKSLKDTNANEEQQNDLDVFNALKALKQSDGGKVLVENLLKDVVNTVGVLENQYKTLSHMEMVAYCASLSEKLSLIRVITRSEQNYKDLQDLLKDTLAE